MNKIFLLILLSVFSLPLASQNKLICFVDKDTIAKNEAILVEIQIPINATLHRKEFNHFDVLFESQATSYDKFENINKSKFYIKNTFILSPKKTGILKIEVPDIMLDNEKINIKQHKKIHVLNTLINKQDSATIINNYKEPFNVKFNNHLTWANADTIHYQKTDTLKSGTILKSTSVVTLGEDAHFEYTIFGKCSNNDLKPIYDSNYVELITGVLSANTTILNGVTKSSFTRRYTVKTKQKGQTDIVFPEEFACDPALSNYRIKLLIE